MITRSRTVNPDLQSLLVLYKLVMVLARCFCGKCGGGLCSVDQSFRNKPALDPLGKRTELHRPEEFQHSRRVWIFECKVLDLVIGLDVIL